MRTRSLAASLLFPAFLLLAPSMPVAPAEVQAPAAGAKIWVGRHAEMQEFGHTVTGTGRIVTRAGGRVVMG
jgi:hypothetical protein